MSETPGATMLSADTSFTSSVPQVDDESANMLSPEPTQQSTVPSSSSAGSAFLPAAISGFIHVPDDVQSRLGSARSSLQPWRAFLGYPDLRHNYSLSMPKYLLQRAKSNLSTYKWNYIIICGATIALLALFHPSFFIVALALLALWFYLFFWRSEAIVAFGQTLSGEVVAIAMTVLSVTLSCICLGSKFLWFLFFDILFCGLHCILRKSAQETVDFGSMPAEQMV